MPCKRRVLNLFSYTSVSEFAFIEAYGKHGNVTRNAAVYWIQIDNTVYQVTRGTTKPETSLTVGKQVQCRTDKDHAFIPDEKGKEVKYSIIGASEAQ